MKRTDNTLSPGDVSRLLYAPATPSTPAPSFEASERGQPCPEVSRPDVSAAADRLEFRQQPPPPIGIRTHMLTRYSYSEHEAKAIAAVADSIKGGHEIALYLERAGESIQVSQFGRVTKSVIRSECNRAGSMDAVRAMLSRMCDEVEQEMKRAERQGIIRPSGLL